MDVSSDKLQADVAPYLRSLEQLPFIERAVPFATSGVLDSIQLEMSSGTVVLAASLVRSHLSQAVVQGLIARGEARGPHLVLAIHVGRETGRCLAEAGVQFIDQAGNCRLNLGGQFAWVEGRPATIRPPSSRALRPPALQVVLALLSDGAALTAPVRELAVLAGGVSPQTAANVRLQLVERGVLVAKPRFQFAQGGRERALEILIAHYPSLAQSWTLARYRTPAQGPQIGEERLLAKLDSLGVTFQVSGRSLARGGGLAVGSAAEPGDADKEGSLIYLDCTADVLTAATLGLRPDPTGDIQIRRLPGPLCLGPDGKLSELLLLLDFLSLGTSWGRRCALALKASVLR